MGDHDQRDHGQHDERGAAEAAFGGHAMENGALPGLNKRRAGLVPPPAISASRARACPWDGASHL
jgi:hypothetical protein